MRLLFIHDNLFQSPDANTRIVFRVIQYWLYHHNVEVSLVGRAMSKGEFIENYNGCKLVHEPHLRVLKAQNLKHKLGKNLHLLRYLLMPRTILYRLHNDEESYVVEMRRWLHNHVQEYDVVIATCSPYYPLKLAAEISKRVPVIYYKIDPVSTAPVPQCLNTDHQLATIDNEIEFDKCASKIITTDVIFKYYSQLPTNINANKVVLLNYPNIVERRLSNNASNSIIDSFDEDKINMCFIGKFYMDVRNPQFILNLMERLQHTNIILHIIGSLGDCSEVIENYISTRGTNIIYHGVVVPSIADDIMLQSDVLLHIGNAEDAYMPSKILDYISSGKPILNLCKIPTCPTLPLMERYPLGMTVYEYMDLTVDVFSQVVTFCEDNRGKSISFDKISEIYYDSTISYVGDKFYEVVESVVKSK